MRRTKEEAARTRQDILNAALTVFSQDGYEAARLEDIGEVAGVTRGAIYHHFDSKAGLFNALFEEASGVGNKAIERAVQEGGNFTEILARILVYTLHLLDEDVRFRDVMKLSFVQIVETPSLAEFTRQRHEQAQILVESISGFFRQAIDQGELRADLPAETAARAFLAYQNGLAYLWLSNPDAFSIKREAEALASVFVQGVVIQ